MSGSDRTFAREQQQDHDTSHPTATSVDASPTKRSEGHAAPSGDALASADAHAASSLGGVTNQMEGAFGMSFGGVTLRTDDGAAQRAEGMGAKAYTDGSEIGFAKGQFDPGSREGQHVIAHEFAHVAQARGGTSGAGQGATLGYDGGTSGAGGVAALATDPEAQANAAADAVVDGKTPEVTPILIGVAKYDPTKKASPPPPVGSYFVSISNGMFVYTFNTDEVKTWGVDPSKRAYEYYVSNAFGRSAAEADAAAKAIGGIGFVDGAFNTSKLPPHRAQPIGITAELHALTKAYFAKLGITGNDPTGGFKDTGGNSGPGGPGGGSKDGDKDGTGTGAKADANGKAPDVDTKDVASAKKLYDFVKNNFPDAIIFGEDGVTEQDLLKFMAQNPDAFKGLPAIPPGGKAVKNLDEWKAFLDKWKAAKDRKVGGTGDGNPDGVHHFHPKGTMLIDPEVTQYVKGSNVVGRVNFDRSDSDNAMMNALPERAQFDWTLYDTNNKLISRSHSFWGNGDISWDATLPTTGTFRLHVAVRSMYFWESLTLQSKDIVVIEEGARDKDVFDGLLVGSEDTKPFTRGPDGKLQLKTGQTALTPQQEIDLVDAQIGSLKALGSQGKLTPEQVDEYVKLLQKQKASLDVLREKIGDKKTYFARGTFVSRENSATTPVKLILYADEISSRVSDKKLVYKLMGYDTTLDAGNPTQHPGEGAADQTHAAQAERNAIDAMCTHIHDHSDYPDGTVHLAIQIQADGSVYEKTIDTHNWKKPAEKALGYVAIVGGVAMILAAPLTGGSSAIVGVIFVTTATAGLASVALSMSEQYAKEGTIKADGRLALNLLQVVSLALGAGTFSAAFKTAGTVGKTMVLGSMLGLDVAQGVMISQSVLGEISLLEASYNPRIAASNDPVEQEKLKREKESAIAQVLGAAAVNGGFILVSVGQGIHAIKSVSPSGKFFNVRPEIAELRKQFEYTRDATDISAYIKDKPLTFEEKAYLEDVLAHIPEKETPTTPEQKAKADAEDAAKKAAGDDLKKKAADAEAKKKAGVDPTANKEEGNGKDKEPPAPKTDVPDPTKATPDPNHPGVEVHNHLLGIPETRYFVDKIGGGDPQKLFEKIDHLFHDSKHAADLKAESPATKQVVDTTRGKLAEMEKAGATKPEKDAYLLQQLDKILAASDETPFDQSYSIRDALIKEYIDPTKPGEKQSYKNFTADALKILADDNIKYSEQSVSAKKLTDNMTPADMAAAHKQAAAAGKDSDMRFLAMMNTKTIAAEAPVEPPAGSPKEVMDAYAKQKADYDKTMAQYKKTLDMIDKVLERGDVMGIDIAGPEDGKFTAEGIQRLLEMYDHISKAAKARGRELVLRPHVGEGYAAPGAEADPAHVDIARANLEMLLKGLEKMGYSATKGKADGVIIRFGHATHATPEQIARMKNMGIIAEANIGSNLATGSISGLEGHPLLYNLFLEEPTILSTDAHGVMKTDLTTEYQRAEQIINDFKAGKTKITIDGVAKMYENPKDPTNAAKDPHYLLPAEKARFSIEKLKAWAAEYGDRVKSGDAAEAAKKADVSKKPGDPPPP